MAVKIFHSDQMQVVIQAFPQTSIVLEKFESYKKTSLDFGDVPVPPDYIQMQHLSNSDLFGRDKYFTHPDEAKAEDLIHIHTLQENSVWEDDEGMLVQWECTSDSYVIYSYFKDCHQDDIFYVIDYCIDKAHQIIEDDEQVKKWIAIAKDFRDKNQ